MADVLTADRVEQIFLDCLFRDDENTDAPVIAQGILNNFGFHAERLAGHREEIGAMLRELPTEFQQDGGGGMSFLNACMDRHGNQWTGLHQTQDHLFSLGVATGQAKALFPRDMWSILPGGMPYYVVPSADASAPA